MKPQKPIVAPPRVPILTSRVDIIRYKTKKKMALNHFKKRNHKFLICK